MPKAGNEKKAKAPDATEPKKKKTVVKKKPAVAKKAPDDKTAYDKMAKPKEAKVTKEAKAVAVLDAIEAHGYTAVIREYEETTVKKVIDSYVRAGLKVLEIATSCPQWAKAVKALRAKSPEVVVGVGTCLTVEHCQAAVKAGAQFVVSPIFDEAVVKEAVRLKTPMMPGCATPAEMKRATALGCPIQKLFKDTTLRVTLSTVGKNENCNCDEAVEKAKEEMKAAEKAPAAKSPKSSPRSSKAPSIKSLGSARSSKSGSEKGSVASSEASFVE